MKLSTLLLLFSLSSNFAFSNDIVTLASGEWYPYQSQTLREGGFVAHIVTEAFKQEGYEVKLVYYPWARGFDKVRTGEVDGSFAYSKTDERIKFALFSDVILSVPIAVFHRRDDEVVWNEVSDLQGLEIGGVLGYDYGLSELEKSNVINIIRIENQIGNYHKLLSGRLDILLEYPNVANKFIDKLNAEDKLVMNPKPINLLSYSLIISKKSKRSEQLIAAFNSGLKKLRESGVYKQIESESNRGAYEK
ncbi:transporter substrate-binding domain-containing protein [Vibrio lamellibrachiae]|uniref:substrate-binding periplasmic protein n=1 Tax=Vibrio lamellibrachiae TaxID=2910253 RepID=UPI003D1497CF